MADHVVGKVGEIAAGEARVVIVDDREIAVFNLGDRWRAVVNQCPHRGGPLGAGYAEDGVVTCPWHGWEFNLDTGVAGHRDDITVGCFPVRVENDTVIVEC